MENIHFYYEKNGMDDGSLEQDVGLLAYVLFPGFAFSCWRREKE